MRHSWKFLFSWAVSYNSQRRELGRWEPLCFRVADGGGLISEASRVVPTPPWTFVFSMPPLLSLGQAGLWCLCQRSGSELANWCLGGSVWLANMLGFALDNVSKKSELTFKNCEISHKKIWILEFSEKTRKSKSIPIVIFNRSLGPPAP